MSYQKNIYYSPEKFGLELVAEIEWSEPNYSFDTTCVWHQKDTGKWFVESDSGCSCPSPFESCVLENLAVYDKTSAIAEVIAESTNHSDDDYCPKSFWQPQLRKAVESIMNWMV